MPYSYKSRKVEILIAIKSAQHIYNECKIWYTFFRGKKVLGWLQWESIQRE
jgi:hypothetical protein